MDASTSFLVWLISSYLLDSCRSERLSKAGDSDDGQ
jgi:hypothetical protein